MARILIADDSRVTRKRIGDYLLSFGHQICAEAVNGKDAVDKYFLHKPDLVTMDIKMPIMDGIAAIKQILQFDHDARIIVVTATGQRKLLLEAIDAGAKDYILKPFDRARIAEAIWNIAW